MLLLLSLITYFLLHFSFRRYLTDISFTLFFVVSQSLKSTLNFYCSSLCFQYKINFLTTILFSCFQIHSSKTATFPSYIYFFLILLFNKFLYSPTVTEITLIFSLSVQIYSLTHLVFVFPDSQQQNSHFPFIYIVSFLLFLQMFLFSSSNNQSNSSQTFHIHPFTLL